VSLSSELHMLAHQLDRLSEKQRVSRDFTLNSLRHALRQVITYFPVYRSYITDAPIHTLDQGYVEAAVGLARRRNPAISASLFQFVRDMLLLRHPESAPECFGAEQRRFVGKFQQVTSPVMAKGMEDTSFYVYNRLISLNEVGGDPEQFGSSPATFHGHNLQMRERWPHSMLATATHDTKRGEDTRARINVLSELPAEWGKAVTRWSRLNRKQRVALEYLELPDPNTEYFLYQTLLGAWPPESAGPDERAEFVRRVQEYMNKAVHEAKVHTSWINPNPQYDDGIREFVARILDEKRSAKFLADFCTFHRRISHVGYFNSLAQSLLKLTSPGVPDTYQGCELWDFSLVDPDNRRPVNYERRAALLEELKKQSGAAGDRLPDFARALAANKEDGRVKLYLTYCTLHCRRDHPGLFTTGAYIPAETRGPRDSNVCAFVRKHEKRLAVAAAPRLLSSLVIGSDGLPLGPDVWADTTLVLPGIAPGVRLRNVFTGEVLTPTTAGHETTLAAADVFRNFPVALLLNMD
jgi:(1->4)-alpha-D-glucan 1-alpha-D-glucosylmutase